MRFRVESFLEIDGSLRVFELSINLVETRPPLRELLLEPSQLLHLDQDLVVRGRSSAHAGRSVVHVSVVRDALHANRRVVRTLFRNVLVRSDEDVPKHVLERSGHLFVVPDQVEREFRPVSFGRGDPVPVGDRRLQVRDGQQDRLGLDRFRLDERRHRAVVFDGDVVQSSTGSNLERRRSGRVGLVEFDQTRDRSVDRGSIEVRVRIVGSEIGARDFVALGVTSLAKANIRQSAPNGFAEDRAGRTRLTWSNCPISSSLLCVNSASCASS